MNELATVPLRDRPTESQIAAFGENATPQSELAQLLRNRSKLLRVIGLSADILKALEQGLVWYRLGRLALKPRATIEESRLSFEVLKYLRAEARLDAAGVNGSEKSAGLADALRSLAIQVNVNANGDPDRSKRNALKADWKESVRAARDQVSETANSLEISSTADLGTEAPEKADGS